MLDVIQPATEAYIRMLVAGAGVVAGIYVPALRRHSGLNVVAINGAPAKDAGCQHTFQANLVMRECSALQETLTTHLKNGERPLLL